MEKLSPQFDWDRSNDKLTLSAETNLLYHG